MNTEERLEIERDKYIKAYKTRGYKMGGSRMKHAQAIVKSWKPGSYIDIGCGRGEMLNYAESLNFEPVFGIEIVESLTDNKKIIYGQAHDLPFKDNSINYITCLDVMEHIPVEDTEIVLYELKRVANKRLLFAIANFKHIYQGMNLHINIKAYKTWHAILEKIYSDATVKHHPKGRNISETWEVIYG